MVDIFGLQIAEPRECSPSVIYIECKSSEHESLDDEFIVDTSQHRGSEACSYILVTNAVITPYCHFRAQQEWMRRDSIFRLVDRRRLADELHRRQIDNEAKRLGLPLPDFSRLPDLDRNRLIVSCQREERVAARGRSARIYLALTNYSRDSLLSEVSTAADARWLAECDSYERVVAPGLAEAIEVNVDRRECSSQRRLEREVIEILDQEKERLGRELHDGLCQMLAGIAALSATLSKRLAASEESAASAAAAEITKLLGECIGEARDLARGLSLWGVNEAGLDEALDALALNVEHLFRVSCAFECERPLIRLRPEVEAHLFRIAQEAVNNAVTHGKAGRIRISLTAKGEEGLLSVRDDGVGMPEGAGNRKGFGMHTMAYRARMIGGALAVRRLRRGTAVICEFPISDQAGSIDVRGSGAQEVLKEIPSEEENSDRQRSSRVATRAGQRNQV